MKILSVTAPANGSGKTTAVAAFLASFPAALRAVKFTTVYKDGVHCPRTESSCACRELRGPYTIVDDPGTLLASGTDTWRMARAGAAGVLWCLARPGAHAAAWDHLSTSHLSPSDRVITEGNTVLSAFAADFMVMVISPAVPRARWKPGSWDLAERASQVVINSHQGSEEAIGRMAEEMAAARAGRRPLIADVSLPLREWDGGLLRRGAAEALGLDPDPTP